QDSTLGDGALVPRFHRQAPFCRYSSPAQVSPNFPIIAGHRSQWRAAFIDQFDVSLCQSGGDCGKAEISDAGVLLVIERDVNLTPGLPDSRFFGLNGVLQLLVVFAVEIVLAVRLAVMRKVGIDDVCIARDMRRLEGDTGLAHQLTGPP